MIDLVPKPLGYFSAEDIRWMERALQIANAGINTTHPNPRVGCVIVRDGRNVGEGFHLRAGEAHAETKALAEAGAEAAGATVYVTLEPCAHTGRTPPCAQALIRAGVGRVVAAIRDPFSAVDGKGFDQLAAAGIPVELGLLSEEAEELNVGFLHRVRYGRPWVRLKLAISLDGRIAMASGESKWLTGSAARRDVHAYRARSDAILTGIGTILADDPALTVREHHVDRQPVRVILDSRGRLPETARAIGAPGDVIVFCGEGRQIPSTINILAKKNAGGTVDLDAVLDELGARNFNELLVEAGGTLSGAFLQSRLVNELLLYQAPCLLGDSAQPMARLNIDALADKLEFRVLDSTLLEGDLRIRLRPAALRPHTLSKQRGRGVLIP
jgi:diaminohydroxyphosphoribosylaminopyrimidine deaminase / 5-amino-6-(5-phosphoribosylamino)uracil reductase